MCGRFSFAASDRIIEELFDINIEADLYKPSYNCAPSQKLAVISGDNPGTLSIMRWGFVPFWAKDISIGNKMINAKSETITEKPSFRQSFRNKRCLVPADAFYEWQQDKDKNPFRIMMKDESLFAMAGLWSRWKDAEDRTRDSFAIITTGANELMQPIHHRMPVILSKKDLKPWLGDTPLQELISLMKPFPAGEMKAYPISKLVNSPLNNNIDIISPINL